MVTLPDASYHHSVHAVRFLVSTQDYSFGYRLQPFSVVWNVLCLNSWQLLVNWHLLSFNHCLEIFCLFQQLPDGIFELIATNACEVLSQLLTCLLEIGEWVCYQSTGEVGYRGRAWPNRIQIYNTLFSQFVNTLGHCTETASCIGNTSLVFRMEQLETRRKH